MPDGPAPNQQAGSTAALPDNPDDARLVAEVDTETDGLPSAPRYTVFSPRAGCSPDAGVLIAKAEDTSRSRPFPAVKPNRPGPSGRGIAILASSIGRQVSPEDLAKFVQQGRFSPVVTDWAWITYHWDRTNFAAINNFLGLMAAQKVPVAAMYRPRFFSNPTVPTLMNQDGERSTDHAEICYSSAPARKWGLSWGEKILDKCPGFREIIIYNPQNSCRCPECTASWNSNPYRLIVHFLAGARSAWRARQPGVKLGVVYMPVPAFWKACSEVVDVAHPYLLISEDTDAGKEIANIKAVRSVMAGKMGPCLGKVTWDELTRISLEKLKAIDGLARENGVPYFLWTFDDLFLSDKYDPEAVVQALGMGTSTVEDTKGRVSTGKTDKDDSSPVNPGFSASKDVPAEILRLVDTYLRQMDNPEPGTDRLDALYALTRKVKEANAAAREFMLSLVIAAMKDKSRTVNQRFQCCYVLCRIGDEPGVSAVIKVLLNDNHEVMRGVAAEALGWICRENPRAMEALKQSARKETSKYVLDTLKRYLGELPTTPITDPGPADTGSDLPPAAAVTTKELAPSGAPAPPPGPDPVAKPLPWPFPGNHKAQIIWNNYQQATDDYIHCGLDFIHSAGTPVTAVDSGYVAAIWSSDPRTHDYFVVTPDKGGNRGWCYAHMDPKTFTFKEGDYIQKGQRLGSLIEFAIDGVREADHLHLSYVEFAKESGGTVRVQGIIDPLYYFDWKDTVPPSFLPLRFVSEGARADEKGVVMVKGKVDIVASITDSAYSGHMGNLGVPVVMLSISDGEHTVRKLVLDHRGDVGDSKCTKPLYLSSEERKAFMNLDSFPRYQMLRVTKTDGDGKIEPEDEKECWDTTAKGADGKPLWPNGTYSVNVYAWDIAGNRGVVGAMVRVEN